MEKITTVDTKLISFTAVAAIIGAGLASAVGVSAFGGDMMGFGGGNFDPEEREALNSALESGDYNTWSEIASTQCANAVTEDRFNEMVERHTENMERHDAVEDILAKNDFEAWSDFISESDDDWGRGRLSEVVTEENFPTFVAMHEAIEKGDVVRVQELRGQLGLETPLRDGTGFGNKGAQRRGQGMRARINN